MTDTLQNSQAIELLSQQTDALVFQSNNRLDGLEVVVGVPPTSEQAIVSAEVGGLMLQAAAPQNELIGAHFGITGSDVAEIVPPTFNEEAADINQKPVTIDELLGPIPEDDAWSSLSGEEAEEVQKRKELQDVITQVQQNIAAGNKQKAVDVISNRLTEGKDIDRTVGVLSALGHTDLVLQASENPETKKTLSQAEIFSSLQSLGMLG